MSKILILALFFYCLSSPAQDFSMEEVRALYQEAALEERACKQLIKLLNPYDQHSNPLLLGYMGSATMMMAQYVSNPFTKLSYFYKGKAMLQNAIDIDHKNMELCFLRFAAQTNAPAILGYQGNIEEDKILILASLPESKDQSLNKIIVGYLKNSEYLNKEEKIKLIALS